MSRSTISAWRSPSSGCGSPSIGTLARDRVRPAVGLVGVVEARPRLRRPASRDDDVGDADARPVVEPRAEVRVHRRVEPDRADERRRALRHGQLVDPLVPRRSRPGRPGSRRLSGRRVLLRRLRLRRGRRPEARPPAARTASDELVADRDRDRVSAVRGAPRRSEALRTCVRTVSAPMPRRCPISSSCRPSARSASTSRSRSVRRRPSTPVFAMTRVYARLPWEGEG